MDSIFSDPGNRIRTIAKISFIISIVLAALVFLIGIIVISEMDEEEAFVGFIATLVACGLLVFTSYIGSLILYSFGELVETNTNSSQRLDNIEYYIAKLSAQPQTPPSSDTTHSQPPSANQANATGSDSISDPKVLNLISAMKNGTISRLSFVSTLDEWKKQNLISEQDYYSAIK